MYLDDGQGRLAIHPLRHVIKISMIESGLTCCITYLELHSICVYLLPDCFT